MIFPELAPINWQSLVGGDQDATAAIAARDRKLAEAAKLTADIFPLASRLHEQQALFVSAPQILAAEPLAARWYLDLAGLTRKLLNKLRPSYAEAGLSINPDSLADRRARGAMIGSDQLAAFSAWINSILGELFPPERQSSELALATVLVLMGARIDGRVRNQTGDDAVVVLKTLLTGAAATRGFSIEVENATGWVEYGPAVSLADHKRLRIGGRLVCEFVPGGNRPDVKVMLDGAVIAVGEIKGRTDLSNLWESWMPQIQGHLQTWTSTTPMAPRLFFGTIITQEMIEGRTVGGTQHNGLRQLRNSGLLSAAYNLSNLAQGEPAAAAAFDDLVDQLTKGMDAS